MSDLRLVVIGAQKAGSSHIAQCIGEHPEIFMVPHEVPYFQDPFFGNSEASTLKAALESPKPVGAIKRPDYLAAAEVPERLHRAFPDVQVIAVLRPPIDRVVSAYYWYMQFGYLPVAPLNEGLAAVLDGNVKDEYPRGSELVENSRYGTHLQRWASVFEPKAMCILASSAVSVAGTYSQIFDGIGLQTDFVPLSLLKRTNDGTYDLKRLSFSQHRRRFLFDWDDTDSYVPKSPRTQAGWRVIPSTVMAAIDKGLLSRVFTDGPERLSQSLRDRLNEVFAFELEIVRDDFGLELAGGKA